MNPRILIRILDGNGTTLDQPEIYGDIEPGTEYPTEREAQEDIDYILAGLRSCPNSADYSDIIGTIEN